MNKFKKIVGPVVLGVMLLASTPTFAYTVKPNDTLSELAVKYDMSVMELAAMNPAITDLNLIYVGQTIKTNKDNNVNTSVSVSTKVSTDIKPKVTTETTTNTGSISASEKDLLARLVRAEANSEPYAGKVAVAITVLNRVSSSQFPDSVTAVIYQNGQFNPVSNGSINTPANSESIRAVEEAINSGNTLNGSLYFYNPVTATNRWLDSKATTVVIGNHTFKK